VEPELPKEMRSATEKAGATPLQTEPQLDWAVEHERMQKQIGSWGTGLLVFGALQLLASGLQSGTWGILLLVVGAASFRFRDVAMFVVYAVTLAWAGIHNLLGGSIISIGLAVIQFVITYQIARDFSRFRKARAESGVVSGEDPVYQRRTARLFPWASLLMGIGSFGGVLGAIAWLLLTADTELEPSALLFGVVVDGLVNVAVLGFAAGLSSLLLKHRERWVAAAGTVACGLVMLAWLVFLLLP
jgi:hypothetical protein